MGSLRSPQVMLVSCRFFDRRLAGTLAGELVNQGARQVQKHDHEDPDYLVGIRLIVRGIDQHPNKEGDAEEKDNQQDPIASMGDMSPTQSGLIGQTSRRHGA